MRQCPSMGKKMDGLTFAVAKKGYQSQERVFEFRLSSSEPLVEVDGTRSIMMEAMVLANGLCVLVVPDNIVEDLGSGGLIDSITFNEHIVSNGEKSAPKNTKKKATKVQIKSPICTLLQQSGSRISLHAPVSGRVLELNQRLPSSPDLLLSGFEGYCAVIQPDDKIAKLIKLQN